MFLRRNLFASRLMLLCAALALAAPAAFAQGGAAATNARPAAGQLVPLPASDAVLFVDVRRLLSEALPRALADHPAKLAEVNADIDRFKAQTGLDPRSFERVSLGVRFTNPSPGVTKIDHLVGIAQGTFNAGALAAAGRLAAKGKYRELQHGGKTVYVFTLNDHVRLFGLLNLRVSDLAVAVLDANTLAIGEPQGVRAAIDAGAGRGRINPELVALARQNPNAVVGFGGHMPAELTRNLDLGNEELVKNIASIRQFYGSLGTTPRGFDMVTVMRTASPADARSLNDTLVAVKQLAPLLVGQLSGDKGRLAKSALDSLRITTQGNDVQINLEVPQSDVAALVRVL